MNTLGRERDHEKFMSIVLQRKVENGKHQNLVCRRNHRAFWTRFSCIQATFDPKLVRIPLIRTPYLLKPVIGILPRIALTTEQDSLN